MAEDGCSMKLPTPQLYPWLMIFHGKASACSREQSAACTFYDNFLEKSYYTTTIPEIGSSFIKIMTNFNGWLVLQDLTNSEISLLNIASLEKVKLPKIFWKVLRKDARFVMNAPPTAPNYFLIIFLPSTSRALIWRKGQQEWAELGYDPEDQLSDVTVCNQKMYGVVQSQHFVSCDIVDDTLKITRLGRKPSNKSRELSTGFKYLIGSEDDVFWIQISRHPWNDPQDIEFIDVFKFDQSNGTWNQVETIDDRVFFLNGNAHPLSCSVTDSSMKKNYIYFFHRRILFSYNMITNKLAMSQPCPTRRPTYCVPEKFLFIMVQP